MPIYAEDHFRSAQTCFKSIVDQLGSSETLGLPHEAVESLLETSGRELLRRLFQDHLDLRRAREERRTEVVGADSTARTHVRARDRGLESVFGRVTINRLAYGGRGIPCLIPLDDELNLPREVYSYGVRRRAAVESSKSSFGEAVESLRSTTGARAAKRQVEELTQRAAQDFDAFYEQRQTVFAERSDLLVLSFDCKGIVMRPQDLREEARRDAERSVRKFDKRRTRGQVSGHKRMAQLATVYDVSPYFRNAEEVVAGFRPLRVVKVRPRPYNKRAWASVAKEGEAIIEEAFREALRRDPKQKRRWVVTIDGDIKQLRKLKRVINRLKVDVEIVHDIVHVLEYLWAAATGLHGEFNPERQTWVTERFLRILQGKASSVAAGMRRSATMRGLSQTARKRVDICARYLLANKSRLRYPRYLAAGMPIGTGVIEGACRHLVQDRFAITGARWSLAGAESVLRIRALRISGDFDEYWRFHLRQEHHRNHVSRYQTAIGAS